MAVPKVAVDLPIDLVERVRSMADTRFLNNMDIATLREACQAHQLPVPVMVTLPRWAAEAIVIRDRTTGDQADYAVYDSCLDALVDQDGGARPADILFQYPIPVISPKSSGVTGCGGGDTPHEPAP